MEKRKSGARRSQAGRKKTAIVQDVLPIADVKGPYAIMKDGSRVGFLELPGINHSLYTEEQKTLLFSLPNLVIAIVLMMLISAILEMLRKLADWQPKKQKVPVKRIS